MRLTHHGRAWIQWNRIGLRGTRTAIQRCEGETHQRDREQQRVKRGEGHSDSMSRRNFLRMRASTAGNRYHHFLSFGSERDAACALGCWGGNRIGLASLLLVGDWKEAVMAFKNARGFDVVTGDDEGFDCIAAAC